MTPTSPRGSRSVTELEDEIAKLRKELAVERMEVLKNRPTRFAAVLTRKTPAKRVHWIHTWTVAGSFLEISTPSKNLVQGKLRTHLWRRQLATPFRKLINSASPSCA